MSVEAASMLVEILRMSLAHIDAKRKEYMATGNDDGFNEYGQRAKLIRKTMYDMIDKLGKDEPVYIVASLDELSHLWTEIQ